MLHLLMSQEVDCHIDPEDLERYAMGAASDEQIVRCEEHLLFCEPCREALKEADAHLAAMRSAAAHLHERGASARPWWSFPRLAPALAAVLLLVAGVVFFRSGGSSLPPVAISLTATRGVGIEAAVPAGRNLAIMPDITALPTEPFYGLEIVDSRGRKTWSGRYVPAEGPSTVSPQRGGTHFVRIYSGSGELLREYGLEIKP